MYSQWAACLWIVLLLGAFAESASIPGALRKRNLFNPLRWPAQLQNTAYRNHLTRDPTCASDTDFNCPAMYKFAKMCDQSKVDKLYYWGYSDFGHCYRAQYRRAAIKASELRKITGFHPERKEFEGCDINWEYVSKWPAQHYQNPQHYDTKQYYTENDWLFERPDCANDPVAQKEQQEPQVLLPPQLRSPYNPAA
ncbi:MAG: hypothetical protein M1815_005247 [Lichina confinis]|nr:MAG: hypothetical protein M1815_005247 [Lichina confinis]